MALPSTLAATGQEVAAPRHWTLAPPPKPSDLSWTTLEAREGKEHLVFDQHQAGVPRRGAVAVRAGRGRPTPVGPDRRRHPSGRSAVGVRGRVDAGSHRGSRRDGYVDARQLRPGG